MLQAPERYLNAVILKSGITKDLSQLVTHFIKCSDTNLHFIVDENEIEITQVLTDICVIIRDTNRNFNFKRGHRVISLMHRTDVYTVSTLQPQIRLVNSDSTIPAKNLTKHIPLSKSQITQIGTIQARLESFERIFGAERQEDFFNNEKLLIIGNRNLYLTIPKDFPACFVSKNETGEAEIEYNSPLLPKIVILKNINLLDNYQQQEINGEQVTFKTCIFVGSSKFENSINIIRNYYNQRRLTKLIFIGEKNFKLDLGNNQIPLRWKWTIPEIIFLKSERRIQHQPIVIHNTELENAIAEFYQTIREIENKHTIGLKSIYRFIRRLYYDWNLKKESTLDKLEQIQREFDTSLRQLLIETLGNIFSDFDFDEYQKPLSEKFGTIIKAIRTNNKTEQLKVLQVPIHQLILPSFKCKENKIELADIIGAHNIVAIGPKTEILSLSKSDDSKREHHKVISSIYGSGKIEKLIERLGRAKSEYKLLLYGIEEKAFTHHIESYISDLNKEYISQDRFQISKVEFSDNYYQFSNYDELIEALASTKHDHRDTDNYKIIFNDNSKMKLPSTKTVLKIQGNEKHLVLVEDLNVGEKVLIYSNPDKKLLRDIMELKNPELIKKADDYSLLWATCLNDAYQNNIMAEPIYEQLVRNHFSISEFTFKKYLEGEVMFPRSFSDLIIIAKTINDPRLSFDFLKNTMKPKIEEYRGMEIEYGFKFSNSINHFIISGEADEFISEWLTTAEIENIVSQIPVKTIKDIELITTNNDD